MGGAASRRPSAITAPARHVPQPLRDAPDRLKNGKILRAAMGDDVIEHCLHTGRWEQMEYDRRATGLGSEAGIRTDVAGRKEARRPCIVGGCRAGLAETTVSY